MQKNDIELIERLIYKNNDDIAVSLSRSLERLEERIDSLENRVIDAIRGKISQSQWEAIGNKNDWGLLR